MIYDTYTYLYPPRPETKIPREMIGFYEKRGWLAQVKKNGTCTVVFAKGDEVIFKTRHNDDHKLWTPKPEHVKFFQGRGDGWNVYVGELLHSKTPHIKDQLFLFDQLVKNGIQLVGSTLQQRIEILTQSFGEGDRRDDQYYVDKYITRAHCYRKGFNSLFDSLKPEDEGLVMKDPNGILKPCFTGGNSSWQVKSRIPHKNYSF